MTTAERDSRGAKVALVSLYNRQLAFEVRSLSAVLKERGHRVDIVFFKEMTPVRDATYMLMVGAQAEQEGCALPPTEGELEELIGLLKDLNPDLVGISLVSSFFQLAEEITRRVKSAMDVPVIWGGSHATLVPEGCIEHADIVCIGEGEGAIVELADRLWRGEDYSDIENLWVRRGDGSVVKNPLRPLVTDLDSLPFPDYADDNKHYILEGVRSSEPPEEEERAAGTYDLMTSRGCPFSCGYCCNSCFREIFKEKGPYVRRRSVGNVIDEVLEVMERRERDYIHFWDDVFTLNKSWIREFRDEWNSWVGLPFTCYAHPVHTDKEILRMLKDCGMSLVNIGIQSGSERTNREVFSRRQKKEEIVEAAKFVADLGGVVLRYDIILDNPFEDESDHRETLDLLLSLPRPFTMLTFSLCHFPKTEMTERALEEGLISESDVEGNSGKAIEQFAVSLQKPRPKLNQFWNILIGMTRHTFFPRRLIRWLSNRGFFRKHPGFLSFLVVRFLKSVGLKYKFINWLRRRPQARIREIGERPIVDVVPLRRETAELIPTVMIRNRGSVPKKVLVCLDIYPVERPGHPKRHLGLWGTNLEFAPGDTELNIYFSLPKVRFKVEGREREPDLVWTGGLKEDGWYSMNLLLMAPERSKLLKKHRVFAKRTIRVHSSELFSEE